MKRKVIPVEQGSAHGPITRLISPSDLGEQLKPFIFLDFFNATIEPGFGFPMHPHSGIATLTWQPGTDVAYEDTTGQKGILKAGGLEWMNSGGGAWHRATLLGSGKATGFQLWVAMPPGIENGPAQGQYIAPEDVPEFDIEGGQVKVFLGTINHPDGISMSPIESHQTMNYLVVSLRNNSRWSYSPPLNHDVAFAVGFAGSSTINDVTLGGGLALLEGSGSLEIVAGTQGGQVLIGSAARHQHELILGSSSVHTNTASLQAGIKTIQNIGKELQSSGRLR